MSAEQQYHDHPALQVKLADCRRLLRRSASVVVAFSGGVDSTFLLALAAETLGRDKTLAAMGVSASLADRERKDGRQTAARLGVELVEIRTGELADPSYFSNPPDRCFQCKSELYRHLHTLAENRGIHTIINGTNADDTGDYRPGLRAASDFGIQSPLLEAGLTKKEIRTASRSMGLSTWDKPAMACLASRIPYGRQITVEKLSRIEQAEYMLRDNGFPQCRVRDHGTIARIEVPPDCLERIVAMREDILTSFRRIGYTYVTLDLQGFRSGSMNEIL
jgi:uncharacterized protein